VLERQPTGRRVQDRLTDNTGKGRRGSFHRSRSRRYALHTGVFCRPCQLCARPAHNGRFIQSDRCRYRRFRLVIAPFLTQL
jgi:hypothetical protein